MKIVDCFLFFNELDLLEIRLNSLAPYVEKFVLCESPVTHTGKSKPLHFLENKSRFKDFNITHLIVDNYEKYINGIPLDMEVNQRDFLEKGISDIDPESIVLLSDVDEIPNLDNYQIGEEGVFLQKMYYYALNISTGVNSWTGTVAIHKKNINTNINNLRVCNGKKHRGWRSRTNIVARRGGWHFSTLGTPEQIIYKIEACCSQRFNTPDIKNRVAENVKNIRDIYPRKSKKFSVETPSGPAWLLENKDKYKHLFYREQINDY